MDIKRILKHLVMTRWRLRRTFPPRALQAIEQAVKAGEAMHQGEIRVAIEAALHGVPLLAGQTPRQRAVEMFAQLAVWDTEHNNGVLIYVLLADRAVELVADRGLNARVTVPEWEGVCRLMQESFRQDRFEQGAVQGVQAVAGLLARHFAPSGSTRNELPDRPVLL